MTRLYKKLWHMLLDRDMSRTQLRELAGISTNALAKLGRDESLPLETLEKVCAALLTLLVLCVGSFSGTGSPDTGRSAYGAFLLTAEAGGYVLTAALAFTAGVIITMLCVKARTKREAQPAMKERDSK